MLNKIKKSRSEGFTIIEVMIVLAIAALILLIVLLAVPALQRNSRNTTVKNDASAMAAGFAEYISNNDGANPASIAQSGASVTIGAAGTSQATAKVNSNTTVNTAKATPTTAKFSQLWWNTGRACDGTTSTRAIAVYYYAEASGLSDGATATPKCVDAG